jgi:hypothetical protein
MALHFFLVFSTHQLTAPTLSELENQATSYHVKSAQLPLFPLILGGPCAQIPMEMGQLIGHEICTGPKV